MASFKKITKNNRVVRKTNNFDLKFFATADDVNPLIDEANLHYYKADQLSRETAAINATATATTAQMLTGYITSTSAAGTSITLPTATQMAAALRTVGITATRGTIFDFIVDNSAGANTVTVVVNTGIAVTTPAITGGATLTVSTANVIGHFRLFFTSATTAKILRLY